MILGASFKFLTHVVEHFAWNGFEFIVEILIMQMTAYCRVENIICQKIIFPIFQKQSSN